MTDDEIVYHKVWKQTQQTFTEVSDRAEWGNWVRFLPPASDMTGTNLFSIMPPKESTVLLTGPELMSMFAVILTELAVSVARKIRGFALSTKTGLSLGMR